MSWGVLWFTVGFLVSYYRDWCCLASCLRAAFRYPSSLAFPSSPCFPPSSPLLSLPLLPFPSWPWRSWVLRRGRYSPSLTFPLLSLCFPVAFPYLSLLTLTERRLGPELISRWVAFLPLHPLLSLLLAFFLPCFTPPLLSFAFTFCFPFAFHLKKKSFAHG